MESKAGSSTITYRLKLHCKHPEWIMQTKVLYNVVLKFYHDLLLEDLQMLALGNMELLRCLEQKTIVGRDRAPVERKLPFEKVPVYFRRAAINAAIGRVRAYYSLLQNWEKKKMDAEQSGHEWNRRVPIINNEFNLSPVLYKGMYKEFGHESLLIKLWNGKSWAWVKHFFSGRKINGGKTILSPTIVIHRHSVALHVPVLSEVTDTRNVRERVKDRERYCAVSFTASDVMATCILFNSDGHAKDSYFIRGGRELAYRRKCLLNTIYKNRKKMGNIIKKGENRHLWEKCKNLNIYYAHLVSKRILDFCLKNNVKILVLSQLPESMDKHLFSERKETNFIARHVVRYLGYKAFQQGIVMTMVRPNYTTIKCSHCRNYIKRYNEGHKAAINYYGGRLFVCPNGHQGNTALNTAKNIGHMFYKKFAFVHEQRIC